MNRIVLIAGRPAQLHQKAIPVKGHSNNSVPQATVQLKSQISLPASSFPLGDAFFTTLS